MERMFTVQFRLVPSVAFSFYPYSEGLYYLVIYGCSSGGKSIAYSLPPSPQLGLQDTWRGKGGHNYEEILSIAKCRKLAGLGEEMGGGILYYRWLLLFLYVQFTIWNNLTLDFRLNTELKGDAGQTNIMGEREEAVQYRGIDKECVCTYARAHPSTHTHIYTHAHTQWRSYFIKRLLDSNLQGKETERERKIFYKDFALWGQQILRLWFALVGGP